MGSVNGFGSLEESFAMRRRIGADAASVWSRSFQGGLLEFVDVLSVQKQWVVYSEWSRRVPIEWPIVCLH